MPALQRMNTEKKINGVAGLRVDLASRNLNKKGRHKRDSGRKYPTNT
jgi:hypothetical protein